jgi:cobalt-zinc-cadmium efflux system outer membrane protein
MRRRLFLLSVAVAVALGACAVSHGTKDVQSMVEARVRHPIERPRAARPDDSAQKMLAQPLDVERAVAIALLQNPRVAAALAELGVARADVVSASRVANPDVEAAVRFAEHGSEPEFDLRATQDLTSVILWPIERGAAGVAFDAAKLDAARAVIDLSFAVRRAFYAYQAALQLEALARVELQAASGAAQLATGLREAGNVSQLDRDTQQVLAEELSTALAQRSAEAAAGRERLAVLLGVAAGDARWTLAGALAEPGAADPEARALEQRALAQSLELRALARRADAASRRHGAATVRAIVPHLNAGVSAERHIDEPWTVGPTVGLSLPIFDQGQGATARAGAEQAHAEALHAAVEGETRAAAREVSVQLAAARAAAVRYRDVIGPLWAKIVEQALQQYNAMETSVFQLVQAKREQLAAQHRYVTALRDYWTLRSAAEQLQAGGSVSALPKESE